MAGYEFRECCALDCRFRYPVLADAPQALKCPYCSTATQLVGLPVPATNVGVTAVAPQTKPQNLTAMLDNIRSIHNVGSMFRTADGAGLAHLHLCGMTATPEHPKLAKAALGAHKTVGWSYGRNAVETAVALKKEGHQLWAIEATPTATPLFSTLPLTQNAPVVIIVGNEKAGVDPGILALCDRILSLPMSGYKQSLNAAVAFGIAAYHLAFPFS